MIELGAILAVLVLGTFYLLDSLVWTFLEYDKYRDKKWLKPIVLCHICMTSFWGTFWYILISNDISVSHYAQSLAVSAFFNILFYSVIERIER